MSALGFDARLWPRVSELLDVALEVPQAARDDWLARLDGDDAETLRPVLRRLLADGSSAEPALPELDNDGAYRPGMDIGPYRLVHPLGQGGMGTVWLARRADGTLQRPVALKLPRVAGSPRLAERLARERDVLAALSHPNIAQLLDAGVTPSGQPFLALEVVAGVPIDRWCAEHALPLAARLELFLQAARAVAHAHAHLVVHRDLKPSNLLVTDEGRLKLLDFGIAKLLDTSDAALTQEGVRPMTPQYAAPEQVAGRPVDTRADVYALGLLLFEMLTGQRPYRLLRSTAAALEEAVLTQEVARPSDSVTDRSAARALKGDLDVIVGKALKKSPAERYATVEALAEDIERHLSHRPVLARPDSAGYVLRRFVRRHRLGAAAMAVALLGVLGGAAAAAWQAHRADLERERARSVSDFVTTLLRDASPYRPAAASWRTHRLMASLMGQAATGGEAPPVTALDLLRQAGQQLDRPDPSLQPDARAELMRVVAEGLMAFGDNVSAERLARQGAQRAAAELGEHHAQTLRTRLVGAQLLRYRGQHDLSMLKVDELLPWLRRLAGAGEAEPLAVALQLRAALAIDGSELPQAHAALAEAAQLVPALPPASAERVSIPTVMSRLQRVRGDAEAARVSAAQALSTTQSLHGDAPHPARIEALVAHARALGDLGRLADALPTFERAVAEARLLFGSDSAPVAFLLQAVVPLDLARSDFAAADRRSAEALRIVRQQSRPGTYAYEAAAAARAAALVAAVGTPSAAPEALTLVEGALPTLKRTVGPRHEQTLAAEIVRLTALARLGRLDDARAGWAALQPSAAAASLTPLVSLLQRELVR
ncbi:MAG: serine/threonine protein kinase [Rubrivivax sp.]|nr:serine/threonine protein kinase [Rubrivivax sp.]